MGYRTIAIGTDGSETAFRAQQAAARFAGRHNVIEDCVFESANSIGAAFLGAGQLVRRCTFERNGQMGWTANSAHNLLMTNSITRLYFIYNLCR